MIPLVPLLLELGELLPDVASGPQSVIAVCELLVPLVLAPGLVDEPLALGLLEVEAEPAVEPVVLPLELVEPDGLFIAEELPGPQSVRLLFIAPLVPVLLLAPGLALVEPVLLVCAIATVPSESARIDAAVRTRRFIRSSSLYKRDVPWDAASRKTHGCGRRSGLAAKSRNAGRRATRARCEKKKGRIEMRPKFREEKPEGLAMRTGGPASHRRKRIGLRFSTNG